MGEGYPWLVRYGEKLLEARAHRLRNPLAGDTAMTWCPRQRINLIVRVGDLRCPGCGLEMKGWCSDE